MVFNDHPTKTYVGLGGRGVYLRRPYVGYRFSVFHFIQPLYSTYLHSTYIGYPTNQTNEEKSKIPA